jgi:hypothetical protein
MSIHSAAAASLSKEDPVCRSVASSCKSIHINKGFHEKGASAIVTLEIIWELANRVSEDFTCQSPNMHPGHDQEAALINNALQVEFSLQYRRAPTRQCKRALVPTFKPGK